MPINAVSSGYSTATVSAPATTQSTRQTTDTSQAARASATTSQALASNDQDNDRDSSAVQATQRVQAAQPTVNTRGQTVGTTINDVA
jgi:hypothetical protein